MTDCIQSRRLVERAAPCFDKLSTNGRTTVRPEPVEGRRRSGALHCGWYGLLTAALLALAPGPVAAICTGDCNADGSVAINELVTGVAESLAAAALDQCRAFDRNDDGQVTIDELIAAVAAALNGCPAEAVAFDAALDSDGPALRLTPRTALRGSTAYAVVLTDGVKDAAGHALQASAEFRALTGSDQAAGDGPVALLDADPDAPDNPYPDSRLIVGDTVRIPDRFALRGLPDTPALAAARGLLRSTADGVGAAGLFSTTAPIRIALSAPVDLATVDADSVRLFARRDGQLGLEPLLAELAADGVARTSVALAVSFPTQAIEDDLLAVRARLDERQRAGALRVILTDPDPSDDLVIGVFGRGAPELADFFAANPDVGTVVHGLLPSPDFRGADGVFDPRKLSGEVAADPVLIDFYLTLPTSPGPYRTVVVQHGFAGDNSFGLTVANELARAGLAGIAISAVSHGRRGNFFDLLTASPPQVRDIFRQTNADQLALVRAMESGIDLDGDGASELDAHRFGYLGVSLGGIIGSVFIAIEPSVQAAVLNVTGGRVAFLGDNPGTRPIYTQYYAMQAQLDLASPEFEVFLQRLLELGQQALDPADPLDYARRWRREPFAGFAPRRVLMQEGIGDQLVSNDSTEALAAAAGLRGDEAMSDAAGVSGLWRFEPPGGHGIFDRSDVRQQAIQFLASAGTQIIAREDCESSDACQGSGNRCVAPDQFVGCGACRPIDPGCASDTQCQPFGAVCAPAPPMACACVPVLQCLAPCQTSALGCATGEQCEPSGHCVATPCSIDADCPSQFACAASACMRKTCGADSDCSMGFCVLGRCFDTLGTCAAPPP
jgi:dienelactone hydrolase